MPLLSCFLSAAAICFLAILSRYGIKPSLRSAYRGWSFSRTVTGFPRSAHVSSGRFRAASLPRGHGARITGCNLPVIIAASQRQALTASDTLHRWRLR